MYKKELRKGACLRQTPNLEKPTFNHACNYQSSMMESRNPNF
ncbi:protein of unknown function [Xenorhabdus bovienii]|uniref:Uncharacterized protein n=1 Tax=Xenorhabdus bovienii TaxID=40576 RepID=A0A0B6XFD5_XENBV|nr:protein of unknown function [Xenorhabdus bovienii]